MFHLTIPLSGKGSRALAQSAILLLISLCTTAPAIAAIPWTFATAAAQGGQTIPLAIKVTPTNEFYIGGTFRSNPKFSGVSLVSTGGADLFLAKYASPGVLEWVIRSGGTQDDRLSAIDLDSAGNVYVTGAFTGSATFASTNKTTRRVNGFAQTIFIARYTAAGVLDWIVTGTSPSSGEINYGAGLAVDSVNGSVFVAALGQEGIVFTSSDGTTATVGGVSTWHMVLARFDTNGIFHWGVTNQASPNSVPGAATVDANGDVYVTGWLENTTTFNSVNGPAVTVDGFSLGQSNTDYPGDAFLAKYDPNGNVQWVNHVGGYKAIGKPVAVDLYGQITLAGFIGNTSAGPQSQARTIVSSQAGAPNISLGGGALTSPYNKDAFFATWRPNGQLVRARRLGSSADENASSIAFSANGGLNMIGLQQRSTGNSLLWHKYWQSALLRGKNVPNAGVGTAEGWAPVCAVDHAGNLLIAGTFSGTVQFGSFKLNSAGANNMYLAELPPN